MLNIKPVIKVNEVKRRKFSFLIKNNDQISERMQDADNQLLRKLSQKQACNFLRRTRLSIVANISLFQLSDYRILEMQSQSSRTNIFAKKARYREMLEQINLQECKVKRLADIYRLEETRKSKAERFERYLTLKYQQTSQSLDQRESHEARIKDEIVSKARKARQMREATRSRIEERGKFILLQKVYRSQLIRNQSRAFSRKISSFKLNCLKDKQNMHDEVYRSRIEGTISLKEYRRQRQQQFEENRSEQLNGLQRMSQELEQKLLKKLRRKEYELRQCIENENQQFVKVNETIKEKRLQLSRIKRRRKGTQKTETHAD